MGDFLTGLSQAINYANPTGKFDLGISEWLANKSQQNDYNKVYVGPGGTAGGASQAELDSAYKVSQLESKAGNTWSQPKTTTPTGGIVKAATTGDPTGGQQQQPSGPSPEELAIRGARSAFENAYNPIFQQLDEWAGLLPAQEAKKTTQLNDLYATQQGELGTNMQGSLGQLDTARGQVAAQKAQSIRDLQQQMNQMSKAGGMQLGSAGAGDSSAARMYNFALSKAAGQSSADVSNQANNMYGQIQGQEQQIRATYDDQMAKLGTWKATQTSAITDWANGQLDQIRSAKLNATGQKAAALASNEVGIINNALSAIQKIDDQITSWNQGIQTWALNRMATIDDAKAKISGYGQYSPAAITRNELQGLNNVQGADSGGMTGFYNAQKKKETDFLSNYK